MQETVTRFKAEEERLSILLASLNHQIGLQQQALQGMLVFFPVYEIKRMRMGPGGEEKLTSFSNFCCYFSLYLTSYSRLWWRIFVVMRSVHFNAFKNGTAALEHHCIRVNFECENDAFENMYA